MSAYLCRWLSIVVLCFTVLFAGWGCQVMDYTVTKRSAIEAQIVAARADTQSQLKTLNETRVGLLERTIAELNAQKQAAGDALFKGTVVFSTLKTPTRPERVMGQSINQTAAYLPSATPAAQAATLKALQTELDEAKTSTEALKAQYEKELGVARAEAATKAAVVTDLNARLVETEKAKETVLAKALQTEQDLQAAKDTVQDKDLAKAREAEQDAKKNEALKRWLMAGLGIIALAAGAVAVFVPIPAVKQYGMVVAIAAAGLAFAVPFITPFYVLIAVLCVCVPVGLRIVWAYKQEHDDATDTYRALNEVKSKASAAFKNEVAPLLREWHTNPATSKRIDERLKQVGDV